MYFMKNSYLANKWKNLSKKVSARSEGLNLILAIVLSRCQVVFTKICLYYYCPYCYCHYCHYYYCHKYYYCHCHYCHYYYCQYYLISFFFNFKNVVKKISLQIFCWNFLVTKFPLQNFRYKISISKFLLKNFR